ncbi:MAG: hypothetical protein K0U72_06575 [Gammaproteobacteria bacterium]|nr:hypothetical protein [Gammaproteobacteria bacterium]
MNEASVTTNDLNKPKMPLDSGAGQTAAGSQTRSAGCTVYRPTFTPPVNWQVREDREFYIPDFLSDTHDDTNPEAYSLAAEHAEHLYKAQGLVGEALNLAGLMLASLGDEADSRAMQTETGLKVIEKKLKKAYNRIDNHDRCHTNLFLAYFNLWGKTDEGTE